MFFDELVGQSVAVQSLMNALKKGRADSVYLFQGPRGTGKTSTAMIFSAALNCDVEAEEMKPCGYCKECSEFMAGKSRICWSLMNNSASHLFVLGYPCFYFIFVQGLP
ncbi:Protein STICHEL-like 1 [Raphanus sativus]|nr:Protein STICHEL-like 1 [Raphanus sativus]